MRTKLLLLLTFALAIPVLAEAGNPQISTVSPTGSWGTVVVNTDPIQYTAFCWNDAVSQWKCRWRLDGVEKAIQSAPSSSYTYIFYCTPATWISSVGVYTLKIEVTSQGLKNPWPIEDTYEWTIVGVPSSSVAVIKATSGSGGTLSENGYVMVTKGDNKTITITPSGGYAVDDVLVDGVSQGAIASYTFTNVQENHEIYATFAPVTTHTITATAGSNGTITPSGAVTVSDGGSQSFTITPDTGYKVADVKVDGSSIGAVAGYTFTNVFADHTISSTFAQTGGGGGGGGGGCSLIAEGEGTSTIGWAIPFLAIVAAYILGRIQAKKGRSI